MKIQSIIASTRPSFLVLSLVSVLLGVALSVGEQALNGWHLGLLFMGAISAHISVNTLNEYHDFRSGLDLKTTRTPFSGGSGALPSDPEAASGVLYVGVFSLILTMVIGLYFVRQTGWGLLPLGLLGILIIISYTPWLNRKPWLCLVAPGLAFGPLMVLGSAYVMGARDLQAALLISLIPFCLANNLLLMNQLPDIEADRDSGRHHFAIYYSPLAAVWVYGVFIVLALIFLLLNIAAGLLPWLALSALIPICAGIFAWRGALNYVRAGQSLQHSLPLNVIAAVLTPLLLAISLYINTIPG